MMFAHLVPYFPFKQALMRAARVCRCGAVPLRSMQSAAALFHHANTCAARGDRIVPADGPFYDRFPTQNRRRALLSADGDESGSLQAGDAAEAHVRALQHMQPEFGTERDRLLNTRAHAIRSAQMANLSKGAWLGAFEPMLSTCPLTARKVAREAVSEFASVVWRCDGLGFAWDCLPGQRANSE